MITITEDQLEKYTIDAQLDMYGVFSRQGKSICLPDGSKKNVSLEDVNQFIYDDEDLCNRLDNAIIELLNENDPHPMRSLYNDAACCIIESAFRSVCEVV